MSWDTIRAKIKTELESVTGVEKVNDYRRHHIDWDKIARDFMVGSKVNGWIIEWAGSAGKKEASGSIAISRVQTIRLWFLYALKDAVASAKTFDALLELVQNHFDGLELLGTTKARMEIPARVLDPDEGMFAGILCHRGQIILNYKELVTP